jgi:hypothetical protein
MMNPLKKRSLKIYQPLGQGVKTMIKKWLICVSKWDGAGARTNVCAKRAARKAIEFN